MWNTTLVRCSITCVLEHDGVEPLRVAMINFFAYTDPVMNESGEADQDWGVVHKVVMLKDGLEGCKVPVAFDLLPALIENMQGPLIHTKGNAASGPHRGQDVMYFTFPQQLSGM